ncbi:MAG: DUF1648 domain-containing protein [Firmicutes bacterium]|nr:DUF1648 domain-containing protein [Bacillota bacterium]
MNFFFFITNLGIIALVAAFLIITPALTRKSLLFGVRVPEAVAPLPEVRGLKRNYYTVILIGCVVLLAAAVLQYVTAPALTLLALLYFPFILVGVQFLAFIPQWKKAKALKEERGWDVPLTSIVETRSSADRQKLSSLPWGWYIASVILVLAMVIWTIAIYPSVPDRIATHWGMNMQPDAWTDKNMLSLLIFPLSALALTVIIAGANILIYRQRLQISAEHPALSFAQHRAYRRMMSHALGFMTLCFTLMFVLMQPVTLNIFAASAAYLPIVVGVTCGLGIIPVLYVSVRAGQSGCKLNPAISERDALSEKLSANVKIAHPGRTDDRYWKLGMFYYNPDDPVNLIEDRFGGNGGFNYAHLPGKLFAGVTAALIVVTYALITYWVLAGGVI